MTSMTKHILFISTQTIDFSGLVPLAWESYYSFSMLGYEVPILGFNLVSRIFIQTTSSPARSKRCESGYIGGNDASQVSGSFTPSKWQPRFLVEGVSQWQVDYKRQKESDLVTDWLVHHLLADAKKGKLPTLPMKVGQPNTLRTPHRMSYNKLASLEATLVRNYDSLTD